MDFRTKNDLYMEHLMDFLKKRYLKPELYIEFRNKNDLYIEQ